MKEQMEWQKNKKGTRKTKKENEWSFTNAKKRKQNVVKQKSESKKIKILGKCEQNAKQLQRFKIEILELLIHTDPERFLPCSDPGMFTIDGSFKGNSP